MMKVRLVTPLGFLEGFPSLGGIIPVSFRPLRIGLFPTPSKSLKSMAEIKSWDDAPSRSPNPVTCFFLNFGLNRQVLGGFAGGKLGSFARVFEKSPGGCLFFSQKQL